MDSVLMSVDVTRRLQVTDERGDRDAWLRIFDCRSEDGGANWSVRIQIVGIPSLDEDVRAIYGVDALQALLFCVKIGKAILESSAEFRDGRLRWECADDLGLPEI